MYFFLLWQNIHMSKFGPSTWVTPSVEHLLYIENHLPTLMSLNIFIDFFSSVKHQNIKMSNEQNVKVALFHTRKNPWWSLVYYKNINQ